MLEYLSHGVLGQYRAKAVWCESVEGFDWRDSESFHHVPEDGNWSVDCFPHDHFFRSADRIRLVRTFDRYFEAENAAA